MKYINASEILPDMLVEELQQYVQAGYIYIPAKDEQHKSGANCLATERNLTNGMKPLLVNIRMVLRLKNLLTNTIFRFMP